MQKRPGRGSAEASDRSENLETLEEIWFPLQATLDQREPSTALQATRPTAKEDFTVCCEHLNIWSHGNTGAWWVLVQPVASRRVNCHSPYWPLTGSCPLAPMLLLAPKPMSPDARPMIELVWAALGNTCITALNLFEIKLDWWWLAYDYWGAWNN